MENTLTNSKEEMGRDQRTTNIWLMLFNLLPRKKYHLQMKSCKFRIWGPTESTKLKMRDHSFLLRKHRCILHQCPWTWAEYIYMAREIYRIHAYNPQREGERERGLCPMGFLLKSASETHQLNKNEAPPVCLITKSFGERERKSGWLVLVNMVIYQKHIMISCLNRKEMEWKKGEESDFSLFSLFPQELEICALWLNSEKSMQCKWAGLGSAPTLKKHIMGPIYFSYWKIPCAYPIMIMLPPTIFWYILLLQVPVLALPDLHVGHVSCPVPFVTSSWWDLSGSLLVVLEAKHRQVFLFLSLCVSQNFMRVGLLSVRVHSHVYHQSFLIFHFYFLMGMSHMILFNLQGEGRPTWATYPFSPFIWRECVEGLLRGFYPIALSSISLKQYSALIPAAEPQLCYDEVLMMVMMMITILITWSSSSSS